MTAGSEHHLPLRRPIDNGFLSGADYVPPAWRYFLPHAVIIASAVAVIVTAHAGADGLPVRMSYLLGVLVVELVLIHQVLAYRALRARTHRSARLENLADLDPVTNLLNHRALVSVLDLALERSSGACSVLFLDLDRFKRLNDTFGHPAGDRALHEFGSVVRAVLRSTDNLGRWGGEEFVAILPETDAEPAMMVAERIRAAVAQHAFWAVGGGHLTCSFGLATYPYDADSRDALLDVADRAMYTAKRLGRNQVRSARSLSSVDRRERERRLRHL